MRSTKRLAVIPGGGSVCDECGEQRRTHCHACGKLLKEREYVEAYGGQRICLTCLGAHHSSYIRP
jgi:ribosomal protein L32